MKVKSESEVARSCLIPSDPMDCSPPGSSVHGIFQARVVEWGAIAFSELSLLAAIKLIGGSLTLSGTVYLIGTIEISVFVDTLLFFSLSY